MTKIIKPTQEEIANLEAEKQEEAYDNRLQYFIEQIREAVEKCQADETKEIEMHVINTESADIVEEILTHVRKETDAADRIKVKLVTVH